MRKKGGSGGFSLIEVLLAITILSTLSLLSSQAISRALKARTKIQSEVDDVSSLRDSMRMIRTDINLAFHHRDFEKELQDLVAKAKTTPQQPGGAPPQATPAPQRQTKRGDPATHFEGTDSEMNFVTLNSGRMSSSTLQADFIEVGYTLKSCNNLSTGVASKCLFRRTQNILDDDVKTGGNEIVMLENVSEFKLRYIDESKQDWVTTWNSTPQSSDAGTKGRYPESVEVTLTIEREIEKKARTYSMLFVIPVHFPNNPVDRNAPAQPNSNGAPNPGGTGG